MEIQNRGERKLKRRAGIGALFLASAIFMTGCTTPDSYGGYYDGGPRYNDRYYGQNDRYYGQNDRDPCRAYRPPSYCGYPSYSGSVYFGGVWHNGNFHYRDQRGGREYWHRGRWHRDERRRPR